MTLVAAHVRVLNSLLFVKDADAKTLPVIDGNGAVWSTPSSVAIGCMPDCDGVTEIILGDLSEIQGNELKLLFEGQLETPSRRLIVQTVLAEKVLQRDVSDTATRLQVWTNGLRDTDKIVVGVG